VAEVDYHTFGAPSDALILGTLAGTRVAFLASRSQSTLLPSGCRSGLYLCDEAAGVFNFHFSCWFAQGKLNPWIWLYRINLLTGQNQFPPFWEGLVAHIAFADPVCNQLAGILADAIL